MVVRFEEISLIPTLVEYAPSMWFKVVLKDDSKCKELKKWFVFWVGKNTNVNCCKVSGDFLVSTGQCLEAWAVC